MLPDSVAAPPIAGLFVEVVSKEMGAMVVSTGFLAAALRALAILRKFPADRVEWTTAMGFAGGFLFGAVLLAFDVVLG